MTEITVKLSTPYTIRIAPGGLAQAGAEIDALLHPARVAVISDSNVAPLYYETLRRGLCERGIEVSLFHFPAGEGSKTLSTMADIYQHLCAQGLTRQDVIVALGGGVVGDMAGFAAATYLRGIRFVQIPTTLLAQIDSSVGGKTGCDLPEGKNLVGAFWQPSWVLCDPQVLSTLPPRVLHDGLAEAIKYGCILDKTLFEQLANQPLEKVLSRVIERCIELKRDLVERDERDTGERMLLNFGHTLGHAIEKSYGFSTYTHGEAVGMGMVLLTRASERAGLTEPGTAERIEAALSRFGLPLSCPAAPEALAQAAHSDKKRSGSQLSLVLLRGIGNSFVYKIDENKLLGFITQGGDSMSQATVSAKHLQGRVTAPPSKSVAHRALICAALSNRPCTIGNIQLSDDIGATLEALRALGASLRWEDGQVRVERSRPAEGPLTIDCGESGSTLRFLIPVAAALGQDVTFVGRGRLPERPLGPYIDIFKEHDLLFESSGTLPLTIHGRLGGGEFTLPGDISSQFVTGLMLAAPLMGEDVHIHLTTSLGSAPYVTITQQMMARFGVEAKIFGDEVFIPGGQSYRPCDYTVEGDWSQAAFWLAAGVIDGDLAVEGLRMDTAQGDKAILEVLAEFGGVLKAEDNLVRAKTSKLRAAQVDAKHIPDLVPVLAVLAACAEGTSRIYNAGRLRAKESDRLSAMAHDLRLLGVEVEEKAEELIITGRPDFAGGTVEGYGDHRVVMSMAVAALRCPEGLTITGPEAVEKSYPNFFEHYGMLGGKADGFELGK